GGIQGSEVRDILEVHNTLRRSISAGTFVAKGRRMPAAATPIPDLTWDCDIEKSAQAVSDRCAFAHSKNLNNLGENLYQQTMNGQETIAGKGKRASQLWADEFQQFGWANIRLGLGAFTDSVGHATQMAWANSTKIGCGESLCKGGNQVIVACQYRNAGNVLFENVYEPKA
ncbi:hypothetical protein PENTCL1PPCAC_14641, partial [Pristionchus entomophagus]